MPSYSLQEAKALDKFYTKPESARFTIDVAKVALMAMGHRLSERCVLEPSAGGGVFLTVLAADGHTDVLAYDVAPEHPEIIKADFLSDVGGGVEATREDVITIGNPPFGKGGRLAVDFLNKALRVSSVVVMILPLTFRKWATQRRVNDDAVLIGDFDLPEDSFTLMGKEYKVRCCVQVWTTEPRAIAFMTDLRKREPLPIKHPDFDCWQYNATEDAKKYFLYDWDFGVLRQGHGDYAAFLKKGDRICDRKQWIFFKARSPEILERLRSMDFAELSRTNTSTPGFGKTEVIAKYCEMFEADTSRGALISIENVLKVQDALVSVCGEDFKGRGGDAFDSAACGMMVQRTGFDLITPETFSNDYKEYKRISLRALNAGRGRGVYDFSAYRGCALSSGVERKDLLIISQPNGSQNFPDALIIVDHVGIPVEFKSGKQDKIVWNSGLPRPDGVYVFNLYGATESATTMFMGDEVITEAEYEALANARRRLEEVAAECNVALAEAGSHLSLYPRPMHNSNMRYAGHPDREMRARRVMDHIARMAFQRRRQEPGAQEG